MKKDAAAAAAALMTQGPYRHYEPYVGSKTTYRLINHKWAEAYLVNTYLQLEQGVTLVVSRTDWQGFLKVQQQQRHVFSAPPPPPTHVNECCCAAA